MTEGLCIKTKEKPLADFIVTKDLIKFLWMCNKYEFPHPRARNQLIFMLILFLYISLRPREVAESSAWLNSNDGLLYRDVALYQQIREEYNRLVLHVKLRNRKGRRLIKSAQLVTLPTYLIKELTCPLQRYTNLI